MSDQLLPAWIEYKKSVDRFTKAKMSSDPGYFAKNAAQRHYELCQACPLPPDTSSVLPLLVLPLRIHLIRSPVLGCSDSLNTETILPIVEQINTLFWEPRARIRFDLVCRAAEERECELPTKVQEELNFFLRHKLRRGTDGRMMHKSERRTKFVHVLLSSFDYKQKQNNPTSNNNNNNNNSNNNDNTNNKLPSYDIWFMDMTGHQSQGICIDRKRRTIIMGERSTKGYDTPTKRPHHCLAKTAAHELGHALSLGHPKGMVFEDGQSQIISRSTTTTTTTKQQQQQQQHEHNNNNNNNNNTYKPNLMSGGADVRGGGGFFLEDWQISATRESAEMFLKMTRQKNP